MGIHRGPNTVKDDLVFGYDTGYGVADNSTATRFYPGKPTTNLLTLSGATSLDVRTDIYSNTTKTDLGGGKYRFVNDGTGGSTIRLYTNLNDLVNGTTYGCSVSYENFNPGDGTSILLDWCDQNNTAFSYANYGSSNRIFMTGARSTYDSTFRFLDISLPVNSAITLFDAQVELSTPSPFTDSTRSDTTSLIDLKRTADIDVSNISFNSTGQPEFDGTDDCIDLNDTLNSISGAATFEMVFKATENNDTYRIMLGWGYGNSNYSGIHIGNWTSGYTDESFHVTFNGSALTMLVRKGHTFYKDNKYHHAVVTTGANNYSIWIDGVEQTFTFQYGTQSTVFNNIVGYNSNIVSHIGKRPYGGGSGYFKGEIPVMKVYDAILTETEIKSNYNAYKNRFNI
jgi:hypothetical protein